MSQGDFVFSGARANSTIPVSHNEQKTQVYVCQRTEEFLITPYHMSHTLPVRYRRQ